MSMRLMLIWTNIFGKTSKIKFMKAVHVIISGRVTGVGFRILAKKEADRLGVVGWIRNKKSRFTFLGKGQVEAVIAGNASAVDLMIEWCHQGPTLASVDKVKVDNAVNNNYQGFSVLN